MQGTYCQFIEDQTWDYYNWSNYTFVQLFNIQIEVL